MFNNHYKIKPLILFFRKSGKKEKNAVQLFYIICEAHLSPAERGTALLYISFTHLPVPHRGSNAESSSQAGNVRNGKSILQCPEVSGAFDHCTSHPNNLFPKRRKESSLPTPTAAREGTTTSLPTTNSRLEKSSIHIHISDRSNRRPSLQVRQRRTQWYCLSNSTPTIRGANISWSGLKRWIPRA